MSDLFQPLAYAAAVEALASTGGWTVHHLSACASGPRPWLRRGSGTGSSGPSFYLSTGIHGDEISGPLAVLEMLKRPHFFSGFNVTLFPILNPDGFAANTRTNAEGIDLNRDYRNPKSAEVASHLEALQTLGTFDASMMLHEDWEGPGAYLYELNEFGPETGQAIIAAMGRHVPIDLRPEIEEAPAEGGIILRRNLILKFGAIEDRPDWPEAIYLSVHHGPISYTTETPMPFPLEDRIQAQIAAVETLLRTLKSKSTGATNPERHSL